MGGYNEVNNDNHKEVILGKISKRIAGGVGALTLLGSGIIAPFAVFAEGEPMVDAGSCFEAGGNTYATFGAARDALGTEGGEIKLVCDAETDKYFGVNKPNITFDLNGHAYTTTKRGFQVRGAYTFTVKDSVGGGSLTAGEAAVDLYNGAKMILEGGDIYASDWGIIVFHDSEFVMNGGRVTCTATDGCYGVTGNGTTNPEAGTYGANAKITLNAGEIVSTYLGVYAPQVGGVTTLGEDLTINAKNAGVEIRAGELNVNGATISVDADAPYSSNSNGNGSTASGVAIAVAQHTTAQPIVAKVTDGVFTAPVVFDESNPQNNGGEDIAKVSLSITGGEFNATNGDPIVASKDVTGFITGGTYNKEPNTEYIAEGYKAVEEDSVYTVYPLATEVTLGNGEELVELTSGESQAMRINYAPEDAAVEFEVTTDKPELFVEGTPKIVDSNGIPGIVFNAEHNISGEATITVTEKHSGRTASVKVKVTAVISGGFAESEDGTVAHVYFDNAIEGENLAIEIAGEEMTDDEKAKISPYLKAVYDISVVNQETGEIVPVDNNSIDVTLWLNAADYKGMKYFKVGYIDEDGKMVETFDTETQFYEESEVIALSFTTTHLSAYGILASETEFPSTLAPDTGTYTVELVSANVAAIVTASFVGVITAVGSFVFLTRKR